MFTLLDKADRKQKAKKLLYLYNILHERADASQHERTADQIT